MNKKKNTVILEEKIATMTKGEYKTVKKEVQLPASPNLTFTGMGGLSGEYQFAEIPGSIVANSMEEAIKQAEDYLAQLAKSRKQ